MRVRWLQVALANLEAAADYIAEDNPSAASRFVQEVFRATGLLARNPAMGRPGRVPGTRELVIPNTPYILPYRARANSLEVLRVFHAARKWPTRF